MALPQAQEYGRRGHVKNTLHGPMTPIIELRFYGMKVQGWCERLLLRESDSCEKAMNPLNVLNGEVLHHGRISNAEDTC